MWYCDTPEERGQGADTFLTFDQFYHLNIMLHNNKFC